YFREMDSFVFKSTEHLTLGGPESFFRKACCSKTVLISHDNQFERRLSGDAPKPGKNARIELEPFQRVDLFVGRLNDQRAVAVDEYYFLHDDAICVRMTTWRQSVSCFRRVFQS